MWLQKTDLKRSRFVILLCIECPGLNLDMGVAHLEIHMMTYFLNTANILDPWPFPHRYHHSPWPVDVTELFPQLCC